MHERRELHVGRHMAPRFAEPTFCCPDCHQRLADLTCAACRAHYGSPDGIPDLLGRGPLAQRCRDIGAYYDRLYAARRDVWAEQGHTPAFTRYLAGLVQANGAGRYLDIGCGEGVLLRETRAMDRVGIDLSREALRRTSSCGARVAIAAAERMPFADASFDIVTSVGAMEHFLDDRAATAEIRRVLRPGGRYVLALLVDISAAERLVIKAREFCRPYPRPVTLARWAFKRLRRTPPPPSVMTLPQQPVQNRYRTSEVRSLFERARFRILDRITKASAPDAPLPGHYMQFYCLEAV